VLAYVDASVWITRVEGFSTYKNTIETCLDELKLTGWQFCASQAVMIETLHKHYRDNNQALLTVYTELFKKTKILPNYSKLFDDALQIVQNESLKAMDSIHAAIAAHHGCDCIITTDNDFKNLKTVKAYWIDLSLPS